MIPGTDYIGVTCVFYCHNGKGKLLLHQRSQKCRDEKGRWDCGGGQMEMGETFEQTVTREVQEEYAVKPKRTKLVGINNLLRKNEKQQTHWVALIFSVLVDPKKVKLNNPEKMIQIGWFSPNKLPKPLHSMFLTHLQFVTKTKAL